MILNREKPTSSILQALKINDNISSDPVEICESLNKHFVSIGKKLSSSLNNQSTNHKQYMGKRLLHSVVLNPTDQYKIAAIISNLNDRKSSGYIDIPVTLIKHAKHLIAPFVAIATCACPFFSRGGNTNFRCVNAVSIKNNSHKLGSKCNT